MDFGYDDTLHDTFADLPTCAPAIFFDTETTGATGTIKIKPYDTDTHRKNTCVIHETFNLNMTSIVQKG